MFSVNIDKIIDMTSTEADSYSDVLDKIYDDIKKDTRLIAVTGDGVTAFKLASELMTCGKKILFVDGNFDTDIFLGKYKLGKSLKGLAEYARKEASFNELRCVTNRKDMDIVFSGMSDEHIYEEMSDIRQRLVKEAEQYDLIVAWSDEQGEMARCCDETIVVIDAEIYNDDSAMQRIVELEKQGCNVLGVIINEK